MPAWDTVPRVPSNIEKREAEPYNETKVMEIMVEKGENTVVAHLQHLKEHNEMEFLKEGVCIPERPRKAI